MIPVIPATPANPMKGRGAVRFSVDCRKPNQRLYVLLAKYAFPAHYAYSYNAHQLSPEIYSLTVDVVRKLLVEKGISPKWSISPLTFVINGLPAKLVKQRVTKKLK